MRKLIPIACLALTGAHLDALAQQATPEERPANAVKPEAPPAVQQVTITNSRASDMDERRNSTAGKQVYGREELDRNGDSTLGEVLKRLPGVTIGGGRPGRGGDVRMRGLGSGYTQVLLNGERAPPGFSLESLSPDQVERVEVMRGPVAENSARAIAGTINVVLRDGYQQRDVQLKLTDAVERGLHSPNVSLTLPGKVGGLSYTLSGSLGRNRQENQGGQGVIRDVRDDGTLVKLQELADASATTSENLHLTPRLSYKFANGDTLNFQPFVMAQRSDGNSRGELRQLAGERPPEYNLALAETHASSTFMRGFGNWLHKLQGAAKLDVKFGFGLGRRDSDSVRNQYDNAGALLDRFTDTDATRDRSLNTGGKYNTPLGQGHLLAAGWDLEAGHREETRVSLDKDGNAQFADSGDNLVADTRRVAVYAQDEWDITPQFGVYLGARWEGIRTTSDRAAGRVANTSRVFSPLLHGVWRIPGFVKDQVRMSLTKSYKSPNVQDLIALPALSRLNSATRPDRSGNPNLKPELATGLDMAYEHYLGRSGILSASAFIRDIDNLIRRELSEYTAPDGERRWLSTPTNISHARTRGIELEAKFQLVELMADAPAIDFRTNYSRFWSSVDGIPGPDNRLDQQPRQTANIGVDYRMKDLPLSMGASFNWTPPIRVQTSTSQTVETSRRRVLDAHVLWRITPLTQLRVSGSNLLADDASSDNLVHTNGLSQMSATLNPTYTVWSARLETKF
ncbi:TonB-dependent receptor plug domain-containing protein [Pseudoduganella namucuonensis]|uniref:Iron complex outermembrane recepter protein n=1 Tax=Pseudoduganella namucuonensis TaxID=1035707 RepID=A0A1I7GDR6_9BURK|nr:TonB-dependent receptor [Pseudoduganella namucuonensis]SFU46471.1 iron complex outermembrane recepter protein [Pseudoduganella namucuonensis]